MLRGRAEGFSLRGKMRKITRTWSMPSGIRKKIIIIFRKTKKKGSRSAWKFARNSLSHQKVVYLTRKVIWIEANYKIDIETEGGPDDFVDPCRRVPSNQKPASSFLSKYQTAALRWPYETNIFIPDGKTERWEGGREGGRGRGERGKKRRERKKKRI